MSSPLSPTTGAHMQDLKRESAVDDPVPIFALQWQLFSPGDIHTSRFYRGTKANRYAIFNFVPTVITSACLI
jgi:hypothetical protein